MMRNLYTTKHSTQTTWIIISGNENNKQCNTSRQTRVVMQPKMINVAAFKNNCKLQAVKKVRSINQYFPLKLICRLAEAKAVCALTERHMAAVLEVLDEGVPF